MGELLSHENLRVRDDFDDAAVDTDVKEPVEPLRSYSTSSMTALIPFMASVDFVPSPLLCTVTES